VLLKEAIPAQDRVLDVLTELYDLQEDLAEEAYKRAVTDYDQAIYLVLFLSSIIIATGLFITLSAIRYTRHSDLALKEEKERAQVTLHSIGDGVIRTDRKGNIEYMNPVAEELTGWYVKSAIGRPLPEIFNIIHDASREPVQNFALLALDAEIVTGQEDITLVTRHGMEHALELTATPVRHNDNTSKGTVIVFRDVTEVRALAREINYRATHDAMTGLMNRTEFERRLQALLDKARQERSSSVLCYLDLDLFKIVNDTCGHLAGDELLRQLSSVLKKKIRKGDDIARIGGDEFGILLSGCTLDNATDIAENIRRSIHDFRFVWDDKSFDVGASIGVVSIQDDSGDLQTIMQAADIACQCAKDTGRNRIYLLRPGDSTVGKLQHDINWVERINRAMQGGGLILHGHWIHPLVNEPGTYSKCEVLLRMEDENGRQINPASFLPAAERYHLMPGVDRWVIKNVCNLLSSIDLQALETLDCFNINISGQSLSDPSLYTYIVDQLDTHSIPPGRICFEITETAAVANMSSAQRLINSLRDYGCRFALDDFGSGLSSFNYLKNMKIDFLKIDGSFVRNIQTDPTDLALINSINQVAHSMGIRTIAEYVENEDILHQLQRLGVDYCQGYVYHQPQPLVEMLTSVMAVKQTG
jgi:diguanylate cyclase (GGDEF)-like protein/PAS domain S-box-containing protein